MSAATRPYIGRTGADFAWAGLLLAAAEAFRRGAALDDEVEGLV